MDRILFTQQLATLIADTLIHSPGVLGDATDVHGIPNVQTAFAVEMRDGKHVVVRIEAFNDAKEYATILARMLYHTLSPWKPIRSVTVAWAAQCIDCGRIAEVRKDGTLAGQATTERCFIDPNLETTRNDIDWTGT